MGNVDFSVKTIRNDWSVIAIRSQVIEIHHQHSQLTVP